MILTLEGYKALEAQLAASKAELANERLKVLAPAGTGTSAVSDQKKLVESLTAQLAAVRAERDELAVKFAKLTADYKELTSKRANIDEELEIRSSRKALEITQSQGVPAVGTTPASHGKADSIRDKYLAEKDPAARAKLWAEHEAEIVSGA